MNWATSSVAISVCICLDVHLFTLNPTWLSCSIWCFYPYAENMDVRVLVKKIVCSVSKCYRCMIG